MTGNDESLIYPRGVPGKVYNALPTFLQKLYCILNGTVDQPPQTDIVRWSDSGNSFFVLNSDRFAKEILGHWFKHQNFNSFVRQLNMYSFKKIPHLQAGSLHSSISPATSNNTAKEYWHFQADSFCRDQPEKAVSIKRKAPGPDDKGSKKSGGTRQSSSSRNEMAPPPPALPPMHQQQLLTMDGEDNVDLPLTTTGLNGLQLTNGQVLDLNSLITGITSIQKQQKAIVSEFADLKRENQMLWQDAVQARQRADKQQETINKILGFLGTFVQQHFGGSGVNVGVGVGSGMGRKGSASREGRADEESRVREEGADPMMGVVVPFNRNRLMIDGRNEENDNSSLFSRELSPISAPTPAHIEVAPSPSVENPPSPTNFNPDSSTSTTANENEKSESDEEFDRKFAQMLNSLTPAQIQGLMSSYMSNSAFPELNTGSFGPSTTDDFSNQQLQPYSNMNSYFNWPSSDYTNANNPLGINLPPSPPPIDAFPPSSTSIPMDGSQLPQPPLLSPRSRWKAPQDIEQDVQSVNNNLADLVNGLESLTNVAPSPGPSSTNLPPSMSRNPSSSSNPVGTNEDAAFNDFTHFLDNTQFSSENASFLDNVDVPSSSHANAAADMLAANSAAMAGDMDGSGSAHLSPAATTVSSLSRDGETPVPENSKSDETLDSFTPVPEPAASTTRTTRGRKRKSDAANTPVAGVSDGAASTKRRKEK